VIALLECSLLERSLLNLDDVLQQRHGLLRLPVSVIRTSKACCDAKREIASPSARLNGLRLIGSCICTFASFLRMRYNTSMDSCTLLTSGTFFGFLEGTIKRIQLRVEHHMVED
jgi:hypothetical protein